jgi:hypothetical protein
VPVKSAGGQADAMKPRVREKLIKQRTHLINALRRHAAAFGVTAARHRPRARSAAAPGPADRWAR